MKYAHQDRIGMRWFYGFKIHDDDTITVLLHDSMNKYDEPQPRSLGEYRAVEDNRRYLQELIINCKVYKVNNPDHVFSYPKFRKEAA